MYILFIAPDFFISNDVQNNIVKNEKLGTNAFKKDYDVNKNIAMNEKPDSK